MNSNGCDHFNMLPIWRIPTIHFLTRILKGSQMTMNSLFVCSKYAENMHDSYSPYLDLMEWQPWSHHLPQIWWSICPLRIQVYLPRKGLHARLESDSLGVWKFPILFFSVDGWNPAPVDMVVYPMLYRACLIHPRWLAGFLWISSTNSRNQFGFLECWQVPPESLEFALGRRGGCFMRRKLRGGCKWGGLL